MVTNANLQSARTARDDEFYTKYADVDAELSHYMPDLKGCRVYCGADGPESMFVRWMLDHWDALELSGLTATQFNPLAPLFGRGARYDWTRPDQNPVESALYDGDLLGDECRAILDASDVFISNPPFSLMRHILPMLGDSGKRFCVLGTLNMLKYNGVFDLILSERLWVGVKTDGHMLFERPDGGVRRLSNCVWLTNMEAPLRVCPPFTPGAGVPSRPTIRRTARIYELRLTQRIAGRFRRGGGRAAERVLPASRPRSSLAGGRQNGLERTSVGGPSNRGRA